MALTVVNTLSQQTEGPQDKDLSSTATGIQVTWGQRPWPQEEGCLSVQGLMHKPLFWRKVREVWWVPSTNFGNLLEHPLCLPEVHSLAPGLSHCSLQVPAELLVHNFRGHHWHAPGHSFTYVTLRCCDHLGLGLSLEKVGETGVAALGVCSKRLCYQVSEIAACGHGCWGGSWGPAALGPCRAVGFEEAEKEIPGQEFEGTVVRR